MSSQVWRVGKRGKGAGEKGEKGGRAEGRGGMEQIFPQSLRKESTLPTPWFLEL